MDFDVVVIGSGPGGYVAAVRAAQLGFKVASVEKNATLGGTCLNVGCIPSKALLESSAHYSFIQHEAEELGITVEGVQFDFSSMMKRKETIVKGLVDSVAHLFKKHKITWIAGSASFTTPNEIEVAGKKISASNFIIATGSQSIDLPFLEVDEKRVVTSTGALALSSVPKSLLVIGGGVIGVEIASIYNRLGSKVTVVEMLDTICAGMDEIVSKTLLQSLKKQGITFHLKSKVLSAKKQTNTYAVTFETSTITETVEVETVLVAVGRRPFTHALNLKNAGITPDKRGFISVDGSFRTSVPHIYAIGDVIEGPMLAHRASYEGVAVAEIIAGQSPTVSYIAIPGVVYTHPEAASIGLTEKEAKELGLQPFTGLSYFKGNGRARCMGDTDGVVKVIGDKASSRLIGLHIVGPVAGEMIAIALPALLSRMKVADLAKAPFAHPTLSEAILEASGAALGLAIHA